MPRKQDPVVTTLDYFQTAPIEAAKTTLTIVTAIVRGRLPAVTKPKKAPRTAPRPMPAPATMGD